MLLFNLSLLSLLTLFITLLELDSLGLLVLTTLSTVSISIVSFSAAFFATSAANCAAMCADSALFGGVPLGAGVLLALDSDDWGGVGLLSNLALFMSSRMFLPVLGSTIASVLRSLCGTCPEPGFICWC